MNDFDPMQYGMLNEKVNNLEKELGLLRKDITELLALANKSKGGFWAGMTIAAAIGSIGTMCVEFFRH